MISRLECAMALALVASTILLLLASAKLPANSTSAVYEIASKGLEEQWAAERDHLGDAQHSGGQLVEEAEWIAEETEWIAEESESYVEEARKERQEARETYVMRPYSLTLPAPTRPRFALCKTAVNDLTPRFDLILVKRGWEDATKLFAGMLKATSVHTMPGVALSFCLKRGLTALASCWNACLNDEGGPLSRLLLVGCPSNPLLPSLFSLLQDSGYQFPKATVRFGGLYPASFGDKTGLFVRYLQSLPPSLQERAYQYAPRTYLVALPCSSPIVSDSQWNWWLADYFHGDQESMTPYRMSGADFVVSEHSDAWRARQPPLDLGRNMWVSKPGSSFIWSWPKIQTHYGHDIDVVFEPEDVLEVINAREMDRDCRGSHRILQKYVEQPPLWGNRKVDFRIFVLTIGASKPIHYLYIGQMPARASRSPYTEEREDSNESTFVTNMSLAKREEDSDEVMLPWSAYYKHLLRAYQWNLPPGKTLEDVLIDRLKNMVAAILQGVDDELAVLHSRQCHLTAWDVIFDKNFHPWLMEINTGFYLNPEDLLIGGYLKVLTAQVLDLAFRDDVFSSSPPEEVQDWRLVHMIDDT